MSYTHFTLEERKYLQQLLSEGYSFRKIAAILERHPSTISREVKRNKAKYRPHGKTGNMKLFQATTKCDKNLEWVQKLQRKFNLNNEVSKLANKQKGSLP